MYFDAQWNTSRAALDGDLSADLLTRSGCRQVRWRVAPPLRMASGRSAGTYSLRRSADKDNCSCVQGQGMLHWLAQLTNEAGQL